jgi:phosphoglycerate kinase
MVMSEGSSCSGGSSGQGGAERESVNGPRVTSPLGYFTLDDFDVKGKRVLIRVDINSPVDPHTMRLRDGSKIASSVPTIRELMDRGARTVIMAHQGRPGEYDFIPLNEHAQYLSRYIGRKVRYVNDLFGGHARKAVEVLEEGEAILLMNVRNFSGEQLKKSPHEHAQSEMVSTLAPLFDLFVNDAFASAHRSHASLVGFSDVLPSAAGRLMEKEMSSLSEVFQSPKRPATYVFGGTKFAEAVPALERLAEFDHVDNILLVGLAGYACLWCLGKPVGEGTEKLVRKNMDEKAVTRARELVDRHWGKIRMPTDAAVEENGARREYPIEELPKESSVLDIGARTIADFSKVIAESGTVFMSGPAGVFEREEFATGTREIFRAMVDSEAYSVIGGGHSSAAANKFGFLEEFTYASTGGGAIERLMQGKQMPVIEALRASARRA